MKYIYWAPQIFGKNHACTLFTLNGLTALKYSGKKCHGDIAVYDYGEILTNTDGDDILYRHRVKLSVKDNGTHIATQPTPVLPVADVPSYWAGNYIFDNQDHVEKIREKWLEKNPPSVDWYKLSSPSKNPVPDYIDPNIPVFENIQRIIDISDPDLICPMDTFDGEPINIDVKKYKHYIPYKSQGYKYLLLDLLSSIHPSQLKDLTGVESELKFQRRKFKSYMRYLESHGCIWDWIDISNDDEYKNKFKLEKTLDFIVNDPRWFDPIVMTDKTKEYIKLVDKYFDKHYNTLNAFFPKVLS